MHRARSKPLPISRTHANLILSVAALAAAQSLAASAPASLLLWNNAAGGSAATAGNWSPVQIPAAADDLTFNLAGTYPITFTSAVATSHTHTYRQGVLTLTMTSPHTVSNGVTVGDLSGDNPTLTLTTGSLVSNAAMIIGDASGSNGTVNVNDSDASLSIGSGADLIVGNNGDATLNITGLGHVDVADQFIAGSNNTSSPTILVSGQLATPPFGSSNLQVLGLSQSRIGQGGDASLTVSNGASATFAGDLVVANGTASTSSITVQNSVLLNARLNVDGDLLLGRNTTGVAAGDGTLTCSNGGTATVGGTLFVAGDRQGGTGHMNVNGTGFAHPANMQIGSGGTVTMGGGTLTCDNPIANNANGLIMGNGVINADINNAGGIIPNNSTLNINGILSNTTSNLIAGGKIHFGPNGGYTGSGTCSSEITGDAGALITATGTLSIGQITSTAGYSYNGDLVVGGNIVTLGDSNGAVLGGTTTMNSGRIECPAGIGVANGGALRGDGLTVGSVTCSGILDPEMPNTLGGLITVQGNMIMNPTSQLHIKLNDVPGSGHNDRVNVSGTASFDGTVHIDIAPGFAKNMHVGEQFILMNATGGRTGTFASVTPNTICNGATLVLVYSSTAAILLVRPTDCDINDDGLINVNDLLAVITHWGPCGETDQPACVFDVDGISPGGQVTIDVNDLLLIITHWGASCP